MQDIQTRCIPGGTRQGKWEAFLGDHLEAEDKGKDRVDGNMRESKERGRTFSRNSEERSDLCWQNGCGHVRLVELKVPVQCSKHSAYQQLSVQVVLRGDQDGGRAHVTKEPEKEREPRDADARGTKDDAGSQC